MRIQSASHKVFRRSWLILAPEIGLALAVSSTVLWCYHRAGLRREWAGLGLAVLPIGWVATRTIRWVFSTWTATADGRLIVKEGVLFRTCQVIHLCSARHVQAEAPLVARWLGVGHLVFRATNQQGQLQLFRWTWLGGYRRLGDIVRARGQLPLGRRSRWRPVRIAIKNLVRTAGAWLVQGLTLGGEMMARLRGRWFVDDYGRFLAFCSHLLRTATGRDWAAPSWVPSAVVRRWMTLLRQARVVVDMPNGGGWRIAGAIHSLDDIRRRIGEEELQRALQRPTLHRVERKTT